MLEHIRGRESDEDLARSWSIYHLGLHAGLLLYVIGEARYEPQLIFLPASQNVLSRLFNALTLYLDSYHVHHLSMCFRNLSMVSCGVSRTKE